MINLGIEELGEIRWWQMGKKGEGGGLGENKLYVREKQMQLLLKDGKYIFIIALYHTTGCCVKMS